MVQRKGFFDNSALRIHIWNIERDFRKSSSSVHKLWALKNQPTLLHSLSVMQDLCRKTKIGSPYKEAFHPWRVSVEKFKNRPILKHSLSSPHGRSKHNRPNLLTSLSALQGIYRNSQSRPTLLESLSALQGLCRKTQNRPTLLHSLSALQDIYRKTKTDPPY